MKTLKYIENASRELVESMQEYSCSQAKYWQQIPYWACKADGRTGFLDAYSRAYRQGYWALNAVGGYYRIYVDLETGRLVCPTNLDRDAAASDVIQLSPNSLDAQSIVESIKAQSNVPYGSYYNTKQREDNEKIINETIERLGLNEETYHRRVSKKQIENNNLTAGLYD